MEFNINGRQFKVDCRDSRLGFDIRAVSDDGGVCVYKCVVTAEEPTVPAPITVEFCVPQVDMFNVWLPNEIRTEGLLPIWRAKKTLSRTALNSPMIAAVRFDDKNGCTAALSDCKTPCTLCAGYVEQNCGVEFRAELFSSAVVPVTRYEVLLYIDTRDGLACDCIVDANRWIMSVNGYESRKLPEAATKPIYAPWYAFHQDFTSDIIYEQCKRAAALGMNTVIIDDGWQTDECTLDYRYCGDWQVCQSKMGDFGELVKKLHDIGVKTVLWFSVPFMGVNARSAGKFKNAVLRLDEQCKAYVLDPRYKAVRDHLVSVYVDFMRKYDLDGFKLDFIDSFTLVDAETNDHTGMDYISVDDAVEVLLKDIHTALTAIKSDALIEFRHYYTGPVMQQYGNMLRVGDCPNDITANRIGSIGLRMSTSGVAVHADPLYWDFSDPPEVAAYQLCHALFAVPQISVDLEKISTEQKRMLEYYLKYQTDNRDVLLFGKLEPHGFAQGYSYVTAVGEKKSITAAYCDCAVACTGETDFDIINGSVADRVVLDMQSEVVCDFTVTDCMGNVVLCGERRLDKGLNSVAIPVSGVAQFKIHR